MLPQSLQYQHRQFLAAVRLAILCIHAHITHSTVARVSLAKEAEKPFAAAGVGLRGVLYHRHGAVGGTLQTVAVRGFAYIKASLVLARRNECDDRQFSCRYVCYHAFMAQRYKFAAQIPFAHAQRARYAFLVYVGVIGEYACEVAHQILKHFLQIVAVGE